MNCNPVYNNKYMSIDAINRRDVRWEKKIYCGFCFRNGRPFDCYMSHNLKLDNGKVVCPILRLYKCPLCHATGDKAHTRKYCPHPERYVSTPEVEQKFCGFCQQNGESRDSYTNHNLKGSGGIVTCPILREYVCPYCAATGDKAHTKTYCPITIERNNGIRPVAPCLLLKWTKYQSNMKRRF